MTPYELRFEIFKQAYAMLSDKFHVKIAELEHISDGNFENIHLEYPNLDDVLQQAKIINEFVSENN